MRHPDYKGKDLIALVLSGLFGETAVGNILRVLFGDTYGAGDGIGGAISVRRYNDKVRQ